MDPADVARYGPRVGPVVASEAGRWHPHVVWVTLYMTAIPAFFDGNVAELTDICTLALCELAAGALSHPTPDGRTKAKILVGAAMGLEAGSIFQDASFSWERITVRALRGV